MQHAYRRTEAVASIHGIELHYEIWGTGAPLLLLHGFTGCAQDFAHAGRDRFARDYQLILPDARGHGGSSNDAVTIRHDQCALDTLALLRLLGIERVRAVGVSMGANILMHMAVREPSCIESMVLVSGTMHFPEQARAIMRALPHEHSAAEWELMRVRHTRGDQQIRALWQAQRALEDSVDDVAFTEADLARITARTLIYYGDADPLYPLAMAHALTRAIAGSESCVVPGGHCPIFLADSEAFVTRALAFLRGGAAA